MTAAKSTAATTTDPLAKLREPFPPHQISKLPKPTKAQTDAVKANFRDGIRCAQCGSWHHPDVVHLDYVGHAALTDRLLDVDPTWSWEPLALRDGLPAFDETGGLWIRLTVCGISRLGYGHAASKQGIDPGAREKEVIGDALRNAAMRFGAALDLWHKGDLHVDDEVSEPKAAQQQKPTQQQQRPREGFGKGEDTKAEKKAEPPKRNAQAVTWCKNKLDACKTFAEFKKWMDDNASHILGMHDEDRAEVRKYCETVGARLQKAEAKPEADPFSDEQPKERGVVGAMKAAISICDDQGALDAWAGDNEANLKGLSDAEYDSVLAFWRQRSEQVSSAKVAA